MNKAIATWPASALPRAADAIIRSIDFIRREWRVYHTVRQLDEMPDYFFRDVGMSRSEITSMIRHGDLDKTRHRRRSQGKKR
ncbi:MAG: DUF1127 domain-containing protein [Pseudorhodoplanes sp.]|nr:DUF1127 domain-containing protein [Pseudorhodoplanes sp.]